MCTTTCVPAGQGIFDRLTEILAYLEANLLLPECANDYCSLLQDILVELQTIVTNTGGGAAAVVLSLTQEINDSGTVPADWKSVTFINQSATHTATVMGVTIQPKVTISAGDFGASPTNALTWASPVGGDLLILEAR